jgi:DNA polymerase III delta prime subunit
MQNNIPWIEKYRPGRFDDIVLDPLNRVLFKNILTRRYFPNLMFYGPPGTGKTTTIINLINEYQAVNNPLVLSVGKNKEGIIHLNASTLDATKSTNSSNPIICLSPDSSSLF